MHLHHIGMSMPNRKEAKPHTHGTWELIYNTQGSGTMTVGQEVYSFLDDTILVCPPGMYHSKSAEQGFIDYYIRFADCDLPPCAYVLRDSHDRRILQLIQVLYTTFYEGCTSSVCSYLLEAILGLLKPMLSGISVSPHVQILRKYIAEGYANPDFSLSDAMAKVPLNTDHLRRLFVRQIGQTPHAYLTTLRLDKAKQILSQEHVSVSDAAYRCGFYDPLYFSKVFQKATGVPPSLWK